MAGPSHGKSHAKSDKQSGPSGRMSSSVPRGTKQKSSAKVAGYDRGNGESSRQPAKDGESSPDSPRGSAGTQSPPLPEAAKKDKGKGKEPEESLDQKVTKLEGDLAVVKLRNEDLEQRIEEKTNEIHRLRIEKANALSNMRTSTRNGSATGYQQWKDRFNELDGAFEKAMAENAAILEDLHKANTKMAVMGKSLRELGQELLEAERKGDRLQTQVEIWEKRVNALTGELNQLKKDYEDLKQRTEKKESTVSDRMQSPESQQASPAAQADEGAESSKIQASRARVGREELCQVDDRSPIASDIPEASQPLQKMSSRSTGGHSNKKAKQKPRAGSYPAISGGTVVTTSRIVPRKHRGKKEKS